MSYPQYGQADYVNVAVSPETGLANYQPIYPTAPVTVVGGHSPMYAYISPEIGRAYYSPMYSYEPVTGVAYHQPIYPTAPVTVVGGYNTPQS